MGISLSEALGGSHRNVLLLIFGCLIFLNVSHVLWYMLARNSPISEQSGEVRYDKNRIDETIISNPRRIVEAPAAAIVKNNVGKDGGNIRNGDDNIRDEDDNLRSDDNVREDVVTSAKVTKESADDANQSRQSENNLNSDKRNFDLQYKDSSGLNKTKPLQFYEGRDFLKDPVYEFDSHFKNPCWFEKNEDGTNSLRCLPYVYIIGVKKCGTSDLFYRLSRHPDFVKPGFKEAQFFARGRFRNPISERGKIEKYVSMFNSAARTILSRSKIGDDGKKYNHMEITGEGSPSNLHLNTHWKHLHGNEGLDEPKYVILDYISHFLPKAKIIITFRDPVERLYSDYYHEYGTLLHKNQPNPYQFHEVVTKGLALYRDCFAKQTIRSCVYEPTIYEKTRIQIQLGVFYIFWEDLLRNFPRDQILMLQNKDLRDTNRTMTTVFDFLGLRKLTDKEMLNVIEHAHVYSRKTSYVDQGPMLNITADALYNFYKPFNIKMAEITGDQTFLYQPVSN